MIYQQETFPVSFVQSNLAKAFNVNNTTGNISIFRITGHIQLLDLWFVVTTALSSNITAAHFRLEDGTNTADVTLATGVTLSSYGIGATVHKFGRVGTALIGLNSNSPRINQSTTANSSFDTGAILCQKASTNTDLVLRYTTTNAPSSGNADFFIRYVPLTASSGVTSL